MSERDSWPDITEILMQDRRAPVFKGGHVHTCPECGEHVPCEDACGCFEDMRLEDGTERGGFVVCEECSGPARATERIRLIDLARKLRDEGPPDAVFRKALTDEHAISHYGATARHFWREALEAFGRGALADRGSK